MKPEINFRVRTPKGDGTVTYLFENCFDEGYPLCRETTLIQVLLDSGVHESFFPHEVEVLPVCGNEPEEIGTAAMFLLVDGNRPEPSQVRK